MDNDPLLLLASVTETQHKRRRALDEIVRKENGEICFIEGGNHVRSEYAVGHKHHGCIKFYEEGKHVRTEFAPGHKMHKSILFYENYNLRRAEYAHGHPRYGQIHFFDNNKVERIERHDEKHFFQDKKKVRIELPVQNLHRHGPYDNHGNYFRVDNCFICKKAALSHAFVRCGHYCACATCADKVMNSTRKCPVCGETAYSALHIVGVIRKFTPMST